MATENPYQTDDPYSIYELDADKNDKLLQLVSDLLSQSASAAWNTNVDLYESANAYYNPLWDDFGSDLSSELSQNAWDNALLQGKADAYERALYTPYSTAPENYSLGLEFVDNPKLAGLQSVDPFTGWIDYNSPEQIYMPWDTSEPRSTTTTTTTDPDLKMFANWAAANALSVREGALETRPEGDDLLPSAVPYFNYQMSGSSWSPEEAALLESFTAEQERDLRNERMFLDYSDPWAVMLWKQQNLANEAQAGQAEYAVSEYDRQWQDALDQFNAEKANYDNAYNLYSEAYGQWQPQFEAQETWDSTVWNNLMDIANVAPQSGAPVAEFYESPPPYTRYTNPKVSYWIPTATTDAYTDELKSLASQWAGDMTSIGAAGGWDRPTVSASLPQGYGAGAYISGIPQMEDVLVNYDDQDLIDKARKIELMRQYGLI